MRPMHRHPPPTARKGDQSSNREEESMNASFDMTLLQKQEDEEGEEANGALSTLRAAASWDEHELTAASKKRSCRVSHDSVTSNQNPPFSSISKAKLPATPASVARRRQLLRSSSPLLPSSSFHPTLDPELPLIATSTSVQKGRRKSKRSFGTCTTAASTIHGSDDHSMHSVDSGDTLTKNFRFTSFPASLPRIQAHPHPPRTTHAAKGAFIAPVSTAKLLHKPHASGHLPFSNNNDSHNTSLSSWNHTADYIGYSEDDEEEEEVSPLQSAASFYQLSTPRARLDFNDVTLFRSETEDDDHHPLDHLLIDEVVESTNKIPSVTTNHRLFSAPSHSASEWDGMDHRHPSADATFVAIPKVGPDEDVHFQLPCSPIPDIPEEETCAGDSTVTGGSSSSHSYSTTTVQCRRFLMTGASAPVTQSSSGRAAHQNGLIPPLSHTRRPMPDLHAFDDGGAVLDGLSSSSISSSTTRSSGEVPTTAPRSPKLLCPPTPVRVHPMFREEEEGPTLPSLHHPKLARSNSLVTNKVLATCSPQLLSTLRSGSRQEERPTYERAMLALDFATTEAFLRAADSDVPREPIPSGELGRTQSEALIAPTKLSSIPDLLESAATTTTSIPTVVSLARNFEVLSTLGSGAFADVYKVASRRDGRTYAIKRNRRQFRSKRDREAALSEVRSMQRIQSQMSAAQPTTNDHASVATNYGIYLLFFYQAWQEDGHILCQTELCCRDTCREMIDTIQSWNTVTSLKFPTVASSASVWFPPVSSSSSSMLGRVVPESVIWKICHDISAGLAFMHSHKVSLVHNDIKPSNILFVQHPQYGALCKIGDFGMARDIGTSEDGQEGDQKYMTLEVLQSGTSYPSADIFSLGLTLYEMASHAHVTIPSDGPRWHELRSGVVHSLDYPADRSLELIQLIRSMMDPNCDARPSANAVLSARTVSDAGTAYHPFLRDYIHDVELRQQQEEQWANHDEQTPQNAMSRPILCSPPLHQIPQLPFGGLCSPKETALASS